jgi:hypothetical protein
VQGLNVIGRVEAVLAWAEFPDYKIALDHECDAHTNAAQHIERIFEPCEGGGESKWVSAEHGRTVVAICHGRGDADNFQRREVVP